MANTGKLIAVPKTPKESFNPDRIASALLQSQVLHLQEALRKHLADLKDLLATNPATLKTERQISEYVHKATALLHQHGAKRPGK